eukprot:scaffold365231_cov35-Attheya_sp.AAC.1
MESQHALPPSPLFTTANTNAQPDVRACRRHSRIGDTVLDASPSVTAVQLNNCTPPFNVQ